MKFDILEHKKNPLMHREEFLIGLDHSGKPTPNRKEIMSELVKELKTKEDLIIIDKIFNKVGKPSSEARVLVYKKPGDVPKYKLEKMKRRLEKKKKEKPATPAEKPEAAEGEKKPAEAKPEEQEAGKEEKKEEKPAEEKPPEEAKEAEKKEEKKE